MPGDRSATSIGSYVHDQARWTHRAGTAHGSRKRPEMRRDHRSGEAVHLRAPARDRCVWRATHLGFRRGRPLLREWIRGPDGSARAAPAAVENRQSATALKPARSRRFPPDPRGPANAPTGGSESPRPPPATPASSRRRSRAPNHAGSTGDRRGGWCATAGPARRFVERIKPIDAAPDSSIES